MNESIHGHRVMEFMLELGRPVTKAELAELLANQFGEQAKFHTCSAQDLSIEGIIAFLERKGKFIESDEGVETARDRICQH
ncbi:YecH family metal-binding protein [Paraferrimonas sedimenticola]|uniref:Metal-binding protein n=1 Tax=Paraferrimonas sedimenticola TaxID=375674 RepID=A0AA37RUP2_9GAMM|nr:YecH family metal-binding protein [Paraferrimonas sedimenticola]GLP95189.1 hypothetical protein GCM10007895_04950 [Paraferrimonas sedimenticola]